MAAILETQRLRLREFTPDDLDALADMVADEEQMTFYPRPKTREEASAWIDRNLALYETLGLGFWAIESISSDFLGYCGIRPLTIDTTQEVEMGWHTRKEKWGQGIATEAAIECRDLAFTQFAIERLVATIDPTHEASLRVATKIGMVAENRAVIDGWTCVVYAIQRS